MSYNFVKKTMPSEIIDNFVPFKKTENRDLIPGFHKYSDYFGIIIGHRKYSCEIYLV